MATHHPEASAPAPAAPNSAPNEAPPPYSETARSGAAFPNEPPPKYEAPPGSDYPQSGYQRLDGTEYQGVVLQELVVKFGTDPVALTCPHCHTYVVTDVEYEAGLLPWLSSGLLCLFGCWMGCCLIPFCIRDLQDAYHRCPQCRRLLGVSRRLD